MELITISVQLFDGNIIELSFDECSLAQHHEEVLKAMRMLTSMPGLHIV